MARAEQRFRDARRHWYDARLGDRERYPLATIWDIVPLFESVDAIAIAQPSRAQPRGGRAASPRAPSATSTTGCVHWPATRPIPATATADTETWFDDNGWWGLAFVNAYRATGARRYLHDAERALHYIARVGWDPAGRGDLVEHPPPLQGRRGARLGHAAGDAALSADTHSSFALAQAEKFLAWANTTGFSAANGLYAASNLDATPIDYIEGPLIYAQELLCRLQGSAALCERAGQLTPTSLTRFGYLLDFSPQYDAIYLQWMLAVYGLDGDRTLYELAADNARDAQTRSLNGEGLYLLSWNGEVLPTKYALPGMLQTQAATTSLFAWLAVYPPPPQS